MLEEASRIFPGRNVDCVVSIGTGVAGVIRFPSSPKTSPFQLVRALTEMATDSDRTAERVYYQYRNTPHVYFRFNVDRGLNGIELDEWKNLSRVRSYTKDFMRQTTVSSQIDAVIQTLLRAGTAQNVASSGAMHHATATANGAFLQLEAGPMLEASSGHDSFQGQQAFRWGEAGVHVPLNNPVHDNFQGSQVPRWHGETGVPGGNLVQDSFRGSPVPQ